MVDTSKNTVSPSHYFTRGNTNPVFLFTDPGNYHHRQGFPCRTRHKIMFIPHMNCLEETHTRCFSSRIRQITNWLTFYPNGPAKKHNLSVTFSVLRKNTDPVFFFTIPANYKRYQGYYYGVNGCVMWWLCHVCALSQRTNSLTSCNKTQAYITQTITIYNFQSI